MSEQQISQLSALFDGEMPREQAEMVIRRVMKDPALQTSWSRYALIGACIRGEPLAATPSHAGLAARVRAQLVNEAELPAPDAESLQTSPARQRGSLLRRGVLGGAIAASVALASVLLVRSMAPSSGAPNTAALIAQQPGTNEPVAPQSDFAVARVARDTLPPSYTTPVDDSPARGAAPLFNYVAAHSDVAASAVHMAPLSSVMGGAFDLTRDAVEMTAAEVGARR